MQNNNIIRNQYGDPHRNYQDILDFEFTNDIGDWFTADLKSTQPSALTDERNNFNILMNPENASKQKYADAAAYTQNVYKIHLMPKSDELLTTVHTILDAYKQLPPEERHLDQLKLAGAMKSWNQ